jgi:hypothetical protein
MSGNVPNVSRTTFDFAKEYGPLVLQQGVPVHDSDINEMLDNLWIRGLHAVNHAAIGDCRLEHIKLDGTSSSNTGMQIIQHATTTTNDFSITDGWAMVGGVLVPSTPASPPVSFDYEDQIMFSGAVTSVGAGNLTDTSKNWAAAHSLTNCRVKMTSGTESGNTFTITSLVSATTVSLSGGTATIAATDTYDVYPPALTTPSGSARTDLVYLMVFFDDIATEEDSVITHPGTSVEAVHKSKIRSIVRVTEGSTTMPTPTEANLVSYGMRYLKLGELARLNGNANVLTAMITNTDNIRKALGHLDASDVAFDDTGIAAIGYGSSDYVQGAIDVITGDLESSLGAGFVGGAAISDSPDSLAAADLQTMIAQLLGHVNDRIEIVHPTTSPTSPALVWRSHGVTSDAAVTGDTVSIYVSNDGWILCRGMYLSGATAYEAPVSPESYAIAIMNIAGRIGFYLKTTTGSATWAYTTVSAWTNSIELTGAGPVFNAHSYTINNMIAITAEVLLRFLGPSTTSNARYTSRYYDYGGTAYSIAEIQKSATLHRIANANLDTPGSGDTIKPILTSIPMQSLQVDGDTGLFRFLCTTHNKASYASGHALASSAWSAKWNFMELAADKSSSHDYVYNCFNSHGNVYEEIIVDNSFKMTRHSSSGNSYMDECIVQNGYNFRNRWNTTPSTVDITGLTNSGTTSVSVVTKDNWGFRLKAQTIPPADSTQNVDIQYYGTVKVYS